MTMMRTMMIKYGKNSFFYSGFIRFLDIKIFEVRFTT